jgi:hypothetical protein
VPFFGGGNSVRIHDSCSCAAIWRAAALLIKQSGAPGLQGAAGEFGKEAELGVIVPEEGLWARATADERSNRPRSRRIDPEGIDPGRLSPAKTHSVDGSRGGRPR